MDASEKIDGRLEYLWSPQQRMDFHLQNWANWHLQHDMPEEFKISCGKHILPYRHFDAEGGYIEVDSRAAEQMEALIGDDIARLEREAVYWAYLSLSWIHAEQPEACLARAKQHLARIMSIRAML